MSTKPNIIYIFSDQHRGDTIGCMDHPAVITPNLDKLAAEGALFQNCFTNSPLCMPARATMMTGNYVCEHGIWDNNQATDPRGPSHVRNIRDAGYHTALIGKTHLYVHGGGFKRRHTKQKIDVLKDWGFEDIHEITGPIASIIHNSPYTDYLKEKGLLRTYRDYMIEYHRNWAGGTAKEWELPPWPIPTEDHYDSYTGRKTVEWIGKYKGDKPFYLQVLFPGPHDPFDSPAEYRGLYKAAEMPVAIMDRPKRPRPTNVTFVLKWSGLDGMTPEQNQLMRAFYYGKISLIDHYIGQIVEALKEKGLLDNTWIIYSSDHGEMLGDHYMNHKIVFYEGALRIPLIIRPPRGIPPLKCKGLTDHIDITTTLLDIAGAKPLKDNWSRSLKTQVLEGPEGKNAQKGKDVVFSEVFKFSMVRNERYKLVVKAKSQKPVEFYDLKTDPNEINNLVNDPSISDIKQELLDTHLKQLLTRMKAGGATGVAGAVGAQLLKE